MPKYTLHRDHTLRTTNGVISFVEGEETWVPPHMEADAVAIGAQIVKGQAPDPLGEKKIVVERLTDEERKAQIFVAFEMLVAGNESSDFTGQGVPTVKAVEKLTGFDVERSEIVELWQAYRTQGE